MEVEVEDERQGVIDALHEGLMNAWDGAVVEDRTHQQSGRRMAEAALKYLESHGFKVVRDR